MSLNVIDFLRESAKYIAKDRPDLYDDESDAMNELLEIMDRMRETPGSGVTSFADFMLIRYQEPGLDEWDLVRKLSSVISYDDEDEVWVHAHTQDSGTLKYGVDLPPVDTDPGI